MKGFALVAVAVWLSLTDPSAAEATESGIEVGWVVADGTLQEPFGMVEATGVGWVRINFRLDAWGGPSDATPRGPDQLTWFQAYDRIIDAYIARGFQVYGLINDEALSSAHPHGSDPWIADFVANAVQIVDHFKDRVRVYEVINEPNNWDNGVSSRFTPRQFAKVLQDTYLAVKHDAGHIDDRCWQVDLVSGPLFAFDDNSAASYLQDTYAIGRGQLAWDYTRMVTGSFPLDGIGYHLYVAQGTESPLTDLRAQILGNLAEVRSVVSAHEGASSSKQFWVSEYGFQATAVGPAGQAERMAAAFDAMAEAGTVALALYFNLRDFPGSTWGIIDDTGAMRPGVQQLAAISAANRPALGAQALASVTAPLAAGELGTVTVTLENRGASTWTDEVRLAAAPGCPDARAANAIAWEPANGYANGTTDARVFLAAPVPPGGSVTIEVPVRAPAEPGNYTFAARLVREGVSWFGATATANVVVLAKPGSGEDPAGSDEDPDGERSGCAAATGGGLPLALALLLLRRRRR